RRLRLALSPARRCYLSRAFTALLSLVEECDLYGLNVAHSGSVVGLMLDRKRHDIARLKDKLAEKKLTRHWPKQHLLKMVTGGVKLQ
ncbi:hypothetical protein SEES7308_01999, partial [Salmonella enterica subsp. enterica serovar Stanley str. ATCC 7308]